MLCFFIGAFVGASLLLAFALAFQAGTQYREGGGE